MIELHYEAVKQALRTLIAGLVALGLTHYFFTAESAWAMATALCVVQMRVGPIFSYHLRYQLIISAISVVLMLILFFVQNSVFLTASILAFTVGTSIFIGIRHKVFFLPLFLISMLVIVASSASFPGPLTGFSIGTLIAMGVTLLGWPSLKNWEIRNRKKQCLKIHFALFKLFFFIYLKHDYLPNVFEYEKRIYRLSQAYFACSRVLRKLHPQEEYQKLERLFEKIVSIGTLRYQVSDYTSLEVIDPDLQLVYQSLSAVFQKLIRNKPNHDRDKVNYAISRVEEVYRGALQVVSQEPVVFLFFIEGLKALNEELADY